MLTAFLQKNPEVRTPVKWQSRTGQKLPCGVLGAEVPAVLAEAQQPSRAATSQQSFLGSPNNPARKDAHGLLALDEQTEFRQLTVTCPSSWAFTGPARIPFSLQRPLLVCSASPGGLNSLLSRKEVRERGIPPASKHRSSSFPSTLR